MKKTTTVLLILVTIAFQLKAQQKSYLGQYHVNPYFLNSSYAGIDDGVRAFAHHRNQWLGVEGAPVTSAFTADWKLGQNPMGLGLKIIRDESNVIGRTDVKLSYAYHFKINEEHYFSLGLGAGVINNSILFNQLKVIDKSEATLLSNSNSQFAFDAEAGANYRFRNKLFLGFSAFQLTSPEMKYQNSIADEDLRFDLVRHYILHGAYQYQIKESDFKIEPHVLVRSTFGLPFQYEGGLSGIYDNKLRINVDYRHEIGMAYSASYLLEGKYTFGYLYNADFGEFAYNSQGTHEVVLGIKFGKANKTNYVSKKEFEFVKRENAKLFEEIESLKQNRHELDRKLKELENIEKKYFEDEVPRKLVRDSISQALNTQDSNNSSGLRSIIGIHSSIESAKEHQRVIKRESDVDTRLILDNSGKWYMLLAEGKEVSANNSYILENFKQDNQNLRPQEGSKTNNNVESLNNNPIQKTSSNYITDNALISDNAYYVILAARYDKKLGIAVYKRIAKNHDVFLVQSASKTWYHVILKEEFTSAEASAKAAEMRKQGFSDAWWTTGKKLTK